MNKYIIFTFIFAISSLSLNLSAQQLPDASFEDWSDSFNGTPQLAKWHGSNVDQAGFKFVFISKDAGRNGSCAKLENKEVGAMGITREAPAYLTLGSPWSYLEGLTVSSATAGTDGGISFKYRPDSLAVWIKRTGAKATSEDYNIVYYSWKGTSSASSYKNSGGGCTSTTHTDEESDIRTSTNPNTCGTNTYATQIAEARLNEKKVYNNWTEVKVPIKYYNDNIPEKMNIIFSAGNYPNGRSNDINAGNTLYVDDVRLIYSSAIHELYINNFKYGAFKPNTLEYTYTLGLGATNIPTIVAKRSGRTLSGSEITIKEGTVDGNPTLITVKAEDGSSTTTYTIYFVSKQSDNSRLNNILYNGNSIAGFSGYNPGPYNIELPYGTTDVPNIEVVKGEDKQTYEISYSSNELPCTATIKSYAQDKNFSTTYTLNFSVGKLSDNTLTNISVGGNAITGFNPTKTNYVVELPQGTTEVPEVTAISAYPIGEQIIEHQNNGINGTYEIRVSAPGNATTRIYKLTFKIVASTNCNLQGIFVDGILLDGFSPETTNYNYILPQGTTVLPEITYTQGDAYQTIVTTSNGVEGTYSIKVTSQSGLIKTYKINFSVYKSDISTLNDIKIGGVSIPDFDANVTTYTYELPTGTTSIPDIICEKGEPNQTITILKGGVNGTTNIRVVAENGINTTNYQIAFSVLKSTDANLTNIKVDGVALDGFRKDSLDYVYILPDDATTCPTIEVETEFLNQTVEIVRPLLNGTATIKVYSETGDSYNIYTIKFAFQQSSNNYLKNIAINSVNIADFDKTITNYSINLVDESTPLVTYEKDDSLQSVVVVNNFANKNFSLIVTAENGNKRTYNLNFNIAQSGNALLKDIKIFDNTTQTFVSLPDFASDKFSYVDTLEWRTKVVPNIHPIVGQQGQIVTISYGKINATTTLHVEAEDGTTQDYVISFPVKKSDITTLEYISLSAGELNFDKDTLFYNVTLPYGTTAAPTIDFGKSVEEQTIKIISKNINDTTSIIVTAENGDKRTYRLAYNVAPSDKENILTNIIIEGIGSFTNSAEFSVPYGTTEAPVFNYVKNFPEQTVLINNGGLYAPTTIIVKSPYEEVNGSDAVARVETITCALSAQDGSATHPSRALSSVTFTGNQGASLASGTLQTAGATSSNKLYYDLRASKTLEVSNGETITTTPNYAGEWMMGYVYVDWNNDGDFSDDGEYVASPKNIANGVYYTKDYAVPNSFNIPSDAKAGTYTMRYTVDWNSRNGNDAIDEGASYSCGRTPSTASGNYTANNGGVMVDLELKITKTSGTVYTFTPKISAPRTSLSEIKVNGNTIEGFKPNKYSYVVNVNNPVGEQPAIEYTHSDDAIVEVLIENTKHVQLRVSDQNDPTYPTSTYDVYFYYPSDVIPNAGFEDWASTVYNGATKPTGWKVAADVVNSYTYSWGIIDYGTYTSGAESARSNTYTQGKYAAQLQTTYHRWSLSGSMPGMITLGDLSISLTNSGNSTSSVSGGIPYRNTPDVVLMDYRPVANDNINNMHFVYTLSDGTNSVNKEFAGKYQNLGSWTTMNLPIYDASIVAPTTLNITINSANTENAKDLGGVTSKTSTLLVDNIRFTHSSALTNIVINGVSNSVTNSYTIDADYQGIPAISAIGEVPDQEHTIQIAETETESGANMLRAVSINSKAEDGTSTNYSFNLTRPKSSNNQLKGIKINGIALVDFEPNKLAYSYTIANGTTRTPDIEVICGSMYQRIKINTNDIKTATIVVTAENGTSTTYSIDFVEEKSDVATLKEITIEGNPADFTFDENTSSYNVSLASDTSLPMVSFSKNSDRQTATMTIGETTTIEVIAENGTDHNTYTINFIREEVSTNATLKEIAIDNETLPTFSPDIYEYGMAKNTNTDFLLTYNKSFDSDSLTTTIYADSVVWYIENNTAAKNRYKLTFTNEISTNAYLEGILVENILIDGFEKDSFNYTITSDTIPDIAIVKGDKNQSVEIATNESQIIITVTAENEAVSQIYTINIESSQPKSDNALLSGIEINGDLLADFSSNIFSYNFVLPMHTTIVPDIIAVLGAQGQSTNIITNGVNGTTTIIVVAENGVTTSSYTIAFSVTPCNNSSLNDIQIDGESLSTLSLNFECDKNFTPETLEYTILFSKDITSFPEIEIVSEHKSCQTITRDTTIISETEQDIQIKVVAENKIDSTIYTLHFIKKKSDNALLNMIFVDGEEIVGFDESVFSYIVNLPYGTTEIPTITCEKQEDVQNIVITPATTLAEETTIAVTAEDGISQNTYTISFSILPSSDATLSGIFIGGELISTSANGFECEENFNAEDYEYNVFLPVGTTLLPEITYTTSVPDVTSVTIESNGVKGTTTITIIAQDGANSESYTINFDVLKSSNNKLSNLLVEGATIGTKQNDPYEVYFGNYEVGNIATTFNPDSTIYTLVYPVGTDSSELISASDITYVLGEASQTADITQATPTEFIVSVTAEDGSKNIYVVSTKILLSNNSLLKDIKLNGISIDDYEPTVFYYEYLLYQGDTIPEILPIKQEDSQTTSVLKGNIGEETIITCQAEDLSTSQYKILFKYSTENPGETPTADDVCWTALGGGRWKASSKRNNVYVYIFEPSGRMIDIKQIPVIDPNSDLCSKDSNGVIFQFEKKGQVYIYLFVHNMKKRLLSGKIIY